MSAKLDRLQAGQRWWPAELVLRGLGLAALDGCYRAALSLHRMVMTPPPHQGTPGELASALLLFLLLASGIALTLEGPGLLRQIPIPPAGVTY